MSRTVHPVKTETLTLPACVLSSIESLLDSHLFQATNRNDDETADQSATALLLLRKARQEARAAVPTV